MAVIFCEEQHNRSGQVTKDGATRTRQFAVKTNNSQDDDTTVEVAPGIAWGSVHPNDASIFVTDVSTTEVDINIWTVTFTYTTPDSSDPCEINPLTCPIEISWSTEKEEEVFNADVDGKKVVNSAKDPFQPLPTRLKSRVVLTAQKNFAAFDGSIALQLDSKVNADAYSGAAPGTLLSSIESATLLWHKVIGYYWQVRVKLTYNEDGWNPMKILDAGMREIDPDDATKKKLILIKGREVTSPVPLSDGTAIQDPTTDPDYLDFKPYNSITYSTWF